MAPLRTLAALVLGASAASAFAPSTPLVSRTVAPIVRYEFNLLWGIGLALERDIFFIVGDVEG